MIELTDVQLRAITRHAAHMYPKECVGIITDGSYRRLKNISKDDNAFEVDSKAFYAIKDVTALIHSHCVDPYSQQAEKNTRNGFDERTPSVADVECQKRLNVPFGIVACDGENITAPVWLGSEPEDLIGRDFIFHINDCFTLVRDYYKKELDIEIFDRNNTQWAWWENESDSVGKYLEHFVEDGWIEIDPRMIEPNDVLLMQVKSHVPNHLAIFLDQGNILHHMYRQKSTTAPYSRWQTYTKKVLRYVGTS